MKCAICRNPIEQSTYQAIPLADRFAPVCHRCFPSKPSQGGGRYTITSLHAFEQLHWAVCAVELKAAS